MPNYSIVSYSTATHNLINTDDVGDSIIVICSIEKARIIRDFLSAKPYDGKLKEQIDMEPKRHCGNCGSEKCMQRGYDGICHDWIHMK